MATGRAKRVFVFIPPLLYMAVVFAISVGRTPPDIYVFNQVDKLYHFIIYSVMGFVWARAFTKGSEGRGKEPRGNRIFLFSFAISLFYGAFLEVVQHFSPERTAELVDVIANGAGGFSGAFVYRYLFLR